jgi:UDPglucose 6-dehydrogenase
MNECKRRIGDKVIYCNDKYTACENCDALCLVTEWDEFKQADFNKVRELMNNNSIIVDGRFIMR